MMLWRASKTARCVARRYPSRNQCLRSLCSGVSSDAKAEYPTEKRQLDGTPHRSKNKRVDPYFFVMSDTGYQTTANGIIVSWKDVAEVYRNETMTSNSAADIEEMGEWIHEKLSLHDNNISLFNVQDMFAFLSTTRDYIFDEVAGGSYDPEALNVQVVDSQDDEKSTKRQLVQMARKLTPRHQQLRFGPGLCQFTVPAISGKWETLQLLKPAPLTIPYPVKHSVLDASIPADITFVVGPDQQRIHVNREVLSCQNQALRKLLSQSPKEIHWPHLSPLVVKAVFDYLTTRDQDLLEHSFPPSIYEESFQQDMVQVMDTILAGANAASPSNDEPIDWEWTNSDCFIHPALYDPEFLDCSLFVGPLRQEVKANRPSLAAYNPVLHSMLYDDTDTDTLKSICLEEFEPEAVKFVLQALLQRGKDHQNVPASLEEDVLNFANYIGETQDTLNLCTQHCCVNVVHDGIVIDNRNLEEWEYISDSDSDSF